MGKIIVIGENSQQDKFTLALMATWLEVQGQCDLARRLFARDIDVYDMHTRPEKGDALDAIEASTELVIALHLYGIDQVTPRYLPGARFYCRNNGHLVFECMQKGIPVMVWGDQPWLGVEKKTLVAVEGMPSDFGIYYYDSFYGRYRVHKKGA